MAERYEITGKIGSGGVGAVYAAVDNLLGRKVAIKRLLAADEIESPELSRGSLQKETAALSALQHPNIVTIYDVGEDEDGQFVVMELIEGENIEEIVEKETLELDVFLAFAVQTLDALSAAQQLDLLHRDIKPRNLMIAWNSGGKPLSKILDFGLAKFAPKPALQTMDQNKAVLGSVFYMAPEQFERRPLDRRTDIYSLGSVFYYALSGHDPYSGKTAVEVMNAHLEHRVHHLRVFRPDIPESVADCVMWMMNREMEDRPQGAEEALRIFTGLQKQDLAKADAQMMAAAVVQVAPEEAVPAEVRTGGAQTRRLATGAVRTRGRKTLLTASTGAVFERDATTGLVPDIENGMLTRPPAAAPARQTTRGVPMSAGRESGGAQGASKALLWFGASATAIALIAVVAVLAASLGTSDNEEPTSALALNEKAPPDKPTIPKDRNNPGKADPKKPAKWVPPPGGGGGDDFFAKGNWFGDTVPEPGGPALIGKGKNRTIHRVNGPVQLTVEGIFNVERYYDVIGFDGKDGGLKVAAGGEVVVGSKNRSKLVIGRLSSGWAEVMGKLKVASDLELGDTRGTVARLTVDGGEVTAPKLRTGDCRWEIEVKNGGKLLIGGDADFSKGQGKILISGGGLLRANKTIGVTEPQVALTLESGGKLQRGMPDSETLMKGWIQDKHARSSKPLSVTKVKVGAKNFFELSEK